MAEPSQPGDWAAIRGEPWFHRGIRGVVVEVTANCPISTSVASKDADAWFRDMPQVDLGDRTWQDDWACTENSGPRTVWRVAFRSLEDGDMPVLTDEQKAERAMKRRFKQGLDAEADALRRQQKHQLWDTEGTRLTRAEVEAGVPCRGCGLPILDGLGNWPPLMHLTDERRLEHEVAEAAFKERHPDCRAHRWSMDGSRATHCGFCCPPVPLSDRQIEELARLLQSFGPTDPADLVTWHLALTCEHQVDHQVHQSQSYWSRSVVPCPECGVDRGVVESRRQAPEEREQAQERTRLAKELASARRMPA